MLPSDPKLRLFLQGCCRIEHDRSGFNRLADTIIRVAVKFDASLGAKLGNLGFERLPIGAKAGIAEAATFRF